ncbi:tripartite-type tricarboxylate transporter receptor subunit TctC [Bradyrhizobium macuxiense]|uniref:Tripartite-type tricarboxylate transporter receptor subunit TctC n=1 Tax=Bradyrhizobium macuxiense TaxID=1755647 RepID=A0A560MIJ2_9BRAD|nr:tripartite tricarboxylate transporter substrate binding protein [Bradyrhizobium macuxiense]TWC07193.1 tripartite-type tricarboxylate transporter receptor subunit TctC [Bradyrhizobium macuxiense]
MNYLVRSFATCFIAAACTLAVTVGGSAAAENFPHRTIKIVVPVPPGPLLDVVPRIIAERLSAKWGVAVIIENRPGAAQNLGAEAVARSDPDGYTLLASPPGPLVVSGHLRSKLNFDPDAFVPVSLMVKLPTVLVVNPKVPASSLQELLAYARANPGKLTFGSPGTGSTPHLATEQLMKAAGIQLVHVPYQGMAPAMNDLIGGHIDMMIDLYGNVAGSIKAGKLRLLAVTTPARLEQEPAVPTISEAVPGFAHVEWFAIVAPPKTPDAIAAKLSAAIAEVLALPEVAGRLADLAAVPVGGTPDQAATFIKAESARWKALIDTTGLKIN